MINIGGHWTLYINFSCMFYLCSSLFVYPKGGRCNDSNWPLAMYLAGPRGQAARVHSIAIAVVGLFLITDY